MAGAAWDIATRRLFGHGDLDRYSVAEVRALKVSAGLECSHCFKYAALDVEELERAYGPQMPFGEVRRLARCRRCGSVAPTLLIRASGVRGDKAWFPRSPGETR